MQALRHLIAVGAVCVFAAPSAMATGVLLGAATFSTPGDLTRIQVGGLELQFLDLPVTAGLSVADAVATYAPFNFGWAGRSEITDLLSAFGITYIAPSGPGDFTAALPSDAAGRASFLSHVGATTGQTSLGWVDDLSSASHHTYLCMSVNLCGGGGSFVFNTTQYWPAQGEVGVFLVRTVPEASTAAMLLAGVACMAALRRQRRPTCCAGTARPPQTARS